MKDIKILSFTEKKLKHIHNAHEKKLQEVHQAFENAFPLAKKSNPKKKNKKKK